MCCVGRRRLSRRDLPYAAEKAAPSPMMDVRFNPRGLRSRPMRVTWGDGGAPYQGSWIVLKLMLQ